MVCLELLNPDGEKTRKYYAFHKIPNVVPINVKETPPRCNDFARREGRSEPNPRSCCQPNLPGGHGLGHQPLEAELLLLEVLGARVLNLQLAHGLAEGLLDLLLLTALELEAQRWVGDDLLHAGDV